MTVKYDAIGTDYNVTRQADPYLTGRLYHLLRPEQNKLYLDLGCGTGNYTVALAEKGLQLTGVEPSETMLEVAEQRNKTIRWLKGAAEQIPAADKTFDGIIATLTIHHWSNLRESFFEIGRVLKPNGRLVIFTSTPEQMKAYWLNHYFPKMLRSSINDMPSLHQIREAAEKANLQITGIEKYFVKDGLQDCFLYIGKNSPERYFNEQIRQGISSFATSANTKEISEGLLRLRQDLESGAFDKIKNNFESGLGDYLFITIEKEAANKTS